MDDVGIVYILKHSTGTTVKVGMTVVNSQGRLSGYTRIYDLKGFRHHKDFLVLASAARDVEKRAHQILKKYQLSGLGSAREIFSCGPRVAERAVEQAISENKEIAEHRLREEKRRVEGEQLKKKADERWVKSNDYADYLELIRCAERIECQEIPAPVNTALWGWAAVFLGAIAIMVFIDDTGIEGLRVLLFFFFPFGLVKVFQSHFEWGERRESILNVRRQELMSSAKPMRDKANEIKFRFFQKFYHEHQ